MTAPPQRAWPHRVRQACHHQCASRRSRIWTHTPRHAHRLLEHARTAAACKKRNTTLPATPAQQAPTRARAHAPQPCQHHPVPLQPLQAVPVVQCLQGLRLCLLLRAHRRQQAVLLCRRRVGLQVLLHTQRAQAAEWQRVMPGRSCVGTRSAYVLTQPSTTMAAQEQQAAAALACAEIET